MNKNKVYILEDRGIIYINGDDVKPFLQNIISNNIEKVQDNKSCSACLLTPQGKYLYDFIIIKHKKGFFIDCEKKIVDELLKKLKSYQLRSKIEILNLSNEFVVAVISKDKFLEFENSAIKLGHTIRFREDPVLLDPRNENLGARLIINLEKLHLTLKQLSLKSSNVNEYYLESCNLGIPQQYTNKLQNNIFGIECNLDELNAIDFKKGCYVGQENTARIKLKDKLNKRLFALKILDGEIGENVSIKNNNKEFGKLLIKEKFLFALIKYKDKDFDFEKIYKCGDANIKVIKPSWLS